MLNLTHTTTTTLNITDEMLEEAVYEVATAIEDQICAIVLYQCDTPWDNYGEIPEEIVNALYDAIWKKAKRL